ncbi:hypothetical protein [Bifidobacterium goeldii]|uniref:hypothetical protein n=1 Tax=Bifidobacterium goeldii TaxID=2306975 RepID=UPI000F7F45C0|nr:hypothetical protein [Bifidobacterium goeldii]
MTLGVHDEYEGVRQALEREPWHASAWYRRRYPSPWLEVVCDADENEPAATQADLPMTFSQKDRRYAGRAVHRYRIDNPGIAGGAHGSDMSDGHQRLGTVPPSFDSTGADDPMNFA